MKLGAFCLAHAVDGPCAAVRREVFGDGRVPVAGFVDRRATLEKIVDQLIEWFDYFVTMRNGESSARTEVVLHVDYQQSLFRFSHTFTGRWTMLHLGHHESQRGGQEHPAESCLATQ